MGHVQYTFRGGRTRQCGTSPKNHKFRVGATPLGARRSGYEYLMNYIRTYGPSSSQRGLPCLN